MAGSQLIIKSQLTARHGELPANPPDVLRFVIGLTADWMMWLAGIALVTAAFMWYFSISRLPLGIAFCYAALSYPFVMIGSQMFLGESYHLPHYIGVAMIFGGLLLVALNS